MEELHEIENENPLSLYMAYDYLPLDQQAKILSAIDGVYKTILGCERSSWSEIELFLLTRKRHSWYYSYKDGFYGPPLCIVSAHTGNSINFKFDHETKFFPRFDTAGEDIDIYVPPWTAAVFLTGAVLTGGLHGYSEYLNIQEKIINIEKAEIELSRLKNESSPEHNQLQIYMNQFHYEINQNNITEVKINDYTIKSPDSDNGSKRR